MPNLRASLQLFKNTGDGVWAVDANQRIIYWSKTAERLLGFAASEALGRKCYQLLAGRDLGDGLFCRAGCAICKQARMNYPIDSFNLLVRNKDGRSSWINVSGIVIPATTNSGNFDAIIHLFRLIDTDSDEVPPLMIRLLGPVDVQRADGSPVDGNFKQRAKVRALFSLLALHRSQGAQRDYLLSTLWPDLTRAAGLHNLYTTVYYLRHCLEPELKNGPDSTYIQNRGERYLLKGSQAHWFDVDSFEKKIAAAHREDDSEKKISAYREAIELYRADFLADLNVDVLGCWMDRERYRLRYLEALQSLAGVLSGSQKYDEAADLYLKILVVNPYHEVAVQELMCLALQRQDRNQALFLYDEFQKRLKSELGAKPRSKTKLLAQKARTTD